MNHRLTELLDSAVPEPVRYLDVDAVLQAARRRRRLRQAAVGAVAALAVLLAVPLSLPTGGGPEEVAGPPPPTVSALQERTPLGEVALGALSDGAPLVHPGSGTLVATVGDNEVWLLERTDGQLCLLSVYELYGSAGTGCAPRSALTTGGVASASRGVREGAPLEVAIAVPDGYTSASVGGVTALVRRNVAVFAFRDVPAGELVVHGEGMRPLAVDLAEIAPGGAEGTAGTDAGAGPEAEVRLLLTRLVRYADAYERDRGTLEGFAASLGRALRSASGLRSLSDDSASAGTGTSCLRADLRVGTLHRSGC